MPAAWPPKVAGKTTGDPENGAVVLPPHPPVIGDPGTGGSRHHRLRQAGVRTITPVNGFAGRKRRKLMLPAPGYSTTAPVS